MIFLSLQNQRRLENAGFRPAGHTEDRETRAQSEDLADLEISMNKSYRDHRLRRQLFASVVVVVVVVGRWRVEGAYHSENTEEEDP